jgi:hypothetical protein
MSLNIDLKTAKKVYPESPDWFQELLSKEFGKDLVNKISFESIKTFEDACEALNKDPYAEINKCDSSDEIAYKKLKIIIEAINQGWKPDWNDSNQQKWYPWFDLSSGFGFDDSCYSCAFTFADCGSRLCFESKEKSNYAAQQFLDLYKQFIK